MLAQNTQIVHAQLSELLTPFNRRMQTGGAYLLWNSATVAGKSALNAEVTRQAIAISYVNDFKLMFWVSLPTALLLLLMRKPRQPAGGAPAEAHAVLD